MIWSSAARLTPPRPFEIKPELPNPHLPDANWADAFEISTERNFSDMRSLAQHTIGSMPKWARNLLRVRNVLLAPFALKADGLNDAPADKGCVDIFPVLAETSDQIVLGLDDWHVDFRIVVDRVETGQAFRLRATTLVERHNAMGRVYIALITPFHRLIVGSVLKNAL